MRNYTITEEDEAKRRKAEARAAKKHVCKSKREASRYSRKVRSSERWIEREVRRLARKAHRDYRKGGKGEATSPFNPPVLFVGWEDWLQEQANRLGVGALVRSASLVVDGPTLRLDVQIKRPDEESS